MNKAAFLRSRTHTYGLLARLYRSAPSVDLLGGLLRSNGSEDLGTILAEGISAVDDPARQVEALAVEYCRLFVGPPPLVSPYQSLSHATIRTGQAGVSFGNEKVRELWSFYRSTGFFVREGQEALADHLAVELAYMSWSANAASTALEASDACDMVRHLLQQEQFLTTNLAVWVPRFCRQVRCQTRLAFYSDLADLTVAFIRFDRRQLKILWPTPASARLPERGRRVPIGPVSKEVK